MTDEPTGELEGRVLLLAPTARDAALARDVFKAFGIPCMVCKDLEEVCSEMARGAGAAIVPEEAIHPGNCLVRALEKQPPWSDFPLIVLMPPHPGSSRSSWALESIGHRALIRRPIEVRVLISATRAALRDRRRQYETRDYLLERERQAEALRASEERYRQLADNVEQLFWTCRPDGQCDYLSPQWVAYTGIPEAEQLGPNWLALVIHPDDRERAYQVWTAAVEDRGTCDLEFRIRRADGAYRWFKTRGNPIRDDAGAIIKWFGTCTDIDAQVKAEAALREADRRKDEFLAMLAHELRNPLSSISNAVQLAGRSGTREHQEWADEVVNRQVKHLARLIDDLLDVSRITRGKIQLRKEHVNVIPILEHAIETLKPLLEAKKHEFHANFGHGMWVKADPTRLEQIVVNLLSNAAKYTEAGGRIRLTASREDGQIVINVADNGIGIPPEDLTEMFELFAQGDRSLARSEGGLGIGLTIVKSLAELHGGSVSAISHGQGRGSEFTVRLPAADAPAARPDAASTTEVFRGRGARILVVDDNVDTARGLSRLLKLLGNDVKVAFSGPEAIELARVGSPDFILLDIGLPGMSGYEVAARLRKECCCQDAVFIAVSGYGQDEDRRRSREAGFDHHLVKPIDHDTLITLISRSEAGG